MLNNFIHIHMYIYMYLCIYPHCLCSKSMFPLLNKKKTVLLEHHFVSVTLCPGRVKSQFSRVTWDARFYPLTGCVPWPSSSATRCSSCAGPRPPGGISQGTGRDSGKVAGPCFASPVP